MSFNNPKMWGDNTIAFSINIPHSWTLTSSVWKAGSSRWLNTHILGIDFYFQKVHGLEVTKWMILLKCLTLQTKLFKCPKR